MATVVADLSMSLDGFVAGPSEGIDRLIDWYANGDGDTSPAVRDTTAVSGRRRHALGELGALVSGRRYFDLAGGWNGRHPMGVPLFVVTHSVPDGWPRQGTDITFVTDGIVSAVAQARAVAGDRAVGVASPHVAQQCLEAGLLDAVRVSLVPVLLGDGAPSSANLAAAHVDLEGPTVVEGTGVTYLYYRVGGREGARPASSR